MPPSYGRTAAGFTPKPTSQILLDMQASIQAAVDPQLDLSAQTPDGQMLGIFANECGALWEVLQAADNEINRQDAEGAALDNIGDLTGTPREGESFTQVYCTLGLDAAHAPYAAGALVANVHGQTSQTYTNLYQIPSSAITGGTATGILFQATVAGQTPAVNANTLTDITTPVPGWSSITNPAGQSQLGTNAELDPAYMVRQVEELAGQGTCNPSATAAAIMQLGASQLPPVPIVVSVVENATALQQTVQGISLPPHSYEVVIYDASGSGWANSGGAGAAVIADTIYKNKPGGIAPQGAISQSIIDPVLGILTMFWATPTARPLFVSATIVPAPTYTGSFAQLKAAVQAALVAAAIAPTPANGQPPVGQLSPGAYVIGAQLQAVMMSVPGVADILGPSGSPGTLVAFDFVSGPTNTNPLPVTAAQVATIAEATVTTNVQLLQGSYP